MVRNEQPRASRRTALAVIAAVNAIAAWGGAAALVVGALDFGDTLNDRLPFDSRVLAGIALAVVVAVPLSVLAAAAWTGHQRTEQLCLAVGTALIAWIVVQILFMRSFSVLQLCTWGWARTSSSRRIVFVWVPRVVGCCWSESARCWSRPASGSYPT